MHDGILINPAAQRKWSKSSCTRTHTTCTHVTDIQYTQCTQDRNAKLLLTSQNALKMMSKQKSGRVVNVTSVVGLVGNAGQVS
jgi:NAD(P)-dependent dehydrogenase (short-subunit alcohol dehydrogenase family)